LQLIVNVDEESSDLGVEGADVCLLEVVVVGVTRCILISLLFISISTSPTTNAHRIAPDTTISTIRM
jgi:hypothetical protein